MGELRLSVVCVAGHQRRRLRRCLDAVAAQSVADRLELVVVDLGAGGEPLEPPAGIGTTRVVSVPPDTPLGTARAAGARAADGDAIAFLFDHGYPEPGWAAALIEAYREPWAAVGYAFALANPGSYAPRAAMVAQFARWLAPARGGPTPTLPGNMVSYRASVLTPFDGDLDGLLEIDMLLHRRIRAAGLEMTVAPGAVVREECFESIRETALANHTYSQLLAIRRAAAENWSGPRRLLYGLAAPLGVAVLRLASATRGATGVRRWLATLPGVLAIAIMASLGEARGYLWRDRGIQERFSERELHAARVP
jgi:hypothetical protein